MDKIQKKEKRACELFASDYHFEMISLPYIEKILNENKEIIILTENNLEKTVKKVLLNINFEDEKKDKIYKINWKNDDFNKYKKIKKNIEDNKEQVIFIKGTKNYISNTNNNIEKWLENSNNVKIIDCYDMQEVSKNLQEITNKYDRILTTSGEKENEKNNIVL